MNYKIIKILQNCGWNKNIRKNVCEIVELYKRKYNIILHKKAIDFLEEFFDITINFFDPIYKKYKTSIVVVGDLCVTYIAYEKYCNYYKKILIPVATVDAYDMVILIDENGVFYGASDQYIAVIGNNFEEVLENMINGVINTEDFPWDIIEDF